MKRIVIVLMLVLGTLNCTKLAYEKYEIIAKEKNLNQSNWGCAKSTFTTVKRLEDNSIVILCGNYGEVGDIIAIRSYK